MNEFKLGTVVRLKSGGPKMTIAEAQRPKDEADETGYICVWFGKSGLASIETGDHQSWGSAMSSFFTGAALEAVS